ncbi:ce4360ad-aa3b-496e-9622-d739346ecf8d [Sclerotinia trifoliorum]|uniref:Ce4360ad-aa3b-496e-9622-d739346ecf8d n=1 Tax=Sclerotinia trifoliorum TaxID=28548 RepID=A0A8H2VUM7_9HELO|nr:ce4360ad-aa3b-496e-9622-d739346ecf8d [Sclerotinia trifoliorum]
MPLPTDPAVVKTSENLVHQLQSMFGKHGGKRPAHAKGLLLAGTFTPLPAASTLSTAPHFNHPSTPIWIRFSNSTGIPSIPDFDAHADPRGIAIRFILDSEKHKHTDIVAHSTPFFPTRTGEEFLEFLQAAAASSGEAVATPKPIEKFLASHPKALAFATAPKPAPTSWVRETYWSVNAFKFIAKDGNVTFVRYRIIPVEGVEIASEEQKGSFGENYLTEEVKARLERGATAEFKLVVQIAGEGDVTDDATEHWPEERKIVELGTIKLEGLLEDNEKEQKHIIFDPIPRVEGIDVSGDPLLDVRAGAYLISGKERRAAA